MPNEIDVFKRVVDFLTLLVISLGLYFAWDQAKKLNESIEANNRSINVSTWASISAETNEIDKMFIDHAELQQYFFENKTISLSDKDYNKVQAIATMMLDYFDSVLSFASYTTRDVPDSVIELGAWNHYFADTFKSSPVLCATYLKQVENYGSSLKKIGVPACSTTKNAAQPPPIIERK